MKIIKVPVCQVCDRPIVGEPALVLVGVIGLWRLPMEEHERGGIVGNYCDKETDDNDSAYHHECLVKALDKACGIDRPASRR